MVDGVGEGWREVKEGPQRKVAGVDGPVFEPLLGVERSGVGQEV